jgi:hypothetical protein
LVQSVGATPSLVAYHQILRKLWTQDTRKIADWLNA